MDSKENKICRLCLNTCNGNFETIQDTDKDMLQILLVNVDFDVSDECVKCKKCTEMLQKCFEFKTVCLHIEDKLIVFMGSRNITRVGMTEVYLDDMQDKKMDHFNTTEICGFCVKPSTTYFDFEIFDEYISDMLEKFLPEVALYFTNNPVSCSNCLDTLKSYFNFLKYLHLVEEHIKVYCETNCEMKSRKVELNNVVEHVLKKILKEKIFIEEQLEVYFSGLITKNFIKNESKIRNVPLLKTMEEITDSEKHCLESSNEEVCIQNYIKSEEIEIKTDETVDGDDNSDSSFSSVKQKNKVTNISHNFEGNTIMVSKELIVLLKREQFISRKKNLKDHLPKKHDNLLDLITSKNQQICDTCGYITTSNLLDHINSKHSQLKYSQLKIFQCNYCSRVLHSKDKLAKHISSIHLKLRPYVCGDCKKTFTRKQGLDNHIVSFHQKNVDLMRTVRGIIHKCDHCTYNSIHKTTMTIHMKTHGSIYKPSQLKNFQCNYCSRDFHSKHKLAEHISSFHIKLRRYFCKGCTKTFSGKGKLDNHIVHLHPENVDLMRTVSHKIYKCDDCTYRCIDKGKMTVHMKTHGFIHEYSPSKNFPCNFCSRVFYLKHQLAKHITSNHLKLGQYFCEGCTKTFPTKRRLDIHIVSIHQQNIDLMRAVTNKIHKCDHCTYRCIQKINMARHMKSHGNIHEHSQFKNFQCNDCLRVFHLKRHLTEHISSIHLKLARCLCKDCKKTFASKAVLDNHILSFHQENVQLMRTVTRKIYECDHCTYRNVNKTKMTIHKKTHDNIHKR